MEQALEEYIIDNNEVVQALKTNDKNKIDAWLTSNKIPPVISIENELFPAWSPILLSPLTYAITNDAWDVAQILVRSPFIDINKKTRDIHTGQPYFASSPLLAAIEKQSDESKKILDILLKNLRTDVNICCESGTPLIRAVVLNNMYAVKRLLNHCRVEVNKKGCEGTTPLIEAITLNNRSALILLLQHPDIEVNRSIDEGRTPLMEAVRVNNVWAVAQLLEHPCIDVALTVDVDGYLLTAEDLAHQKRDNYVQIKAGLIQQLIYNLGRRFIV